MAGVAEGSGRLRRLLGAFLVAVVVGGCSDQGGDVPPGKTVLEMWHSQKRQNEDALKDIVARFNAQNATYHVRLHNIGSYTALFRKARATLQSGQLPDLCICYPSMVAEFMEADAVLPLDDLLRDPQHGFTREELDDIFPVFLEDNRYPEFGNRLLSFPFTKSLLMLYYNAEILRAAGHEGPPETWEEFIAQCRDVKAKTGKLPFAYSRDPSSFDSMVMSLGGRLASVEDRRSHFDSPEAIRALEILHTLASEGLAQVIAFGSDEDRTLFANGRVAFIMRSSTTRAYMAKDIVDERGRDRFEWGMACPPIGKGQPKQTVLYGGNILVFKSNRKRHLGAWEFIKFFVSPEITAEWSVRTGYLPIRRSAARTKTLQEFFARHPRNRVPFETIPYSRREPSVAGWQAVRTHIATALTRVVTGRMSPAQAARELARAADAELARFAQRAGKR